MNQFLQRFLLALVFLLVGACGTAIKLPISLDNGTTDQYSAVMIDGPALPLAGFFTDNVHLLREYFSRNKTAPLSIDNVAENLLGGRTPLSTLAAKYLRDPDAFKRRDQAPVLKQEIESILLSGATVPAVAIWHQVYIGPYDFHANEFKVCFRPDCAPLPGNELRYRYGTRDYELVVRGIPASFQMSPREAVAREIEHGASMQTPRGMPVLVIAEFANTNTGEDLPIAGQLKADIAGIRIYRRSSFGVRTDIPPPPERLLLTVRVSPEKVPANPRHPTQPKSELPEGSQSGSKHAANGSLTSTARVFDLLFRNTPEAGRLSEADKSAIANQLPLAAGPNGLIDTSCKQQSHVRVVLLDLNSDKQPEVIVTEGNTCVYGMSGGVSHFFTKTGNGKWTEILTSDGDALGPPSYKVLLPSNAKPGQWAEVMPGVKGFCYPVYSYAFALRKYILARKIADKKRPNACSQ